MAGKSHAAIGVINEDLKENRAFLAFSRHFRGAGLPTPEIYAENADLGVYLEEDLGDTNLFQYLSANRGEKGISEPVLAVYRKSVKMLPRFQIEAGKTLDYGNCYPRASFDKQSMLWDLNYFKYYFLRLAHIPFNEQALEEDFEVFANFLLEAERTFFLYRDFQSRNIMVKNGEPYFIDYQGGRKGALQYDIASLLCDAKADLPFELRSDLLGLYLDAASALAPIDRAQFMRYYHGFVYIRIIQALGTYGLRGYYERKPHFLQSIPYAIRNLEYLLRTSELPIEIPELLGVIKRLVASSALRQYGNADLKLTVRIQSFSYRNGIPIDERGHGGGFVFDCRALPNPGKLVRFARMTGKDVEVVEFLEKEPAVAEYLRDVFALIDRTVQNYKSRNFTDLQVAFGCTGGQHRSVYCAQRLARHLQEKHGVRVEVAHREAERFA
jgi:aminoglycoside/choline kinase family phosphotransferase